MRYHPRAELADKYFRIEDYKRTFDRPPLDLSIMDKPPWAPFESREDFKFAEVALEGSFSAAHVNDLLNLFHNVQSGDSKISFRSYNDVKKAWEKASLKHAPVGFVEGHM